MKSAKARRTAYTSRMESSLIDPTLTAMNPRQKAKFAAYVATFYPKQATLRGILDAAGIGGQAAFPYEAFNAEAFSITRRFTGPAAVADALILSGRYDDLGLVHAVLCAILTQAHGIVLPTPGTPTCVTPVNHAPAEPKAGTLTFLGAANCTGYDVWLGPNAGPVVEVSHNQRGLTYAYSGLAGLTLHDWYIFGRNVCGPGAAAPTFDFTTVA